MPSSGRPGQQAIPRAIIANAGDTGDGHCHTGKLLTQQQLADQRGNDQQCQSSGSFADRRGGQRAFHRFPVLAPVLWGFCSSIGSGSGAGVGPSSALACAGSLSSGSSLNVSLLILPVNLKGGS